MMGIGDTDLPTPYEYTRTCISHGRLAAIGSKVFPLAAMGAHLGNAGESYQSRCRDSRATWMTAWKSTWMATWMTRKSRRRIRYPAECLRVSPLPAETVARRRCNQAFDWLGGLRLMAETQASIFSLYQLVQNTAYSVYKVPCTVQHSPADYTNCFSFTPSTLKMGVSR
jgi:hypothetical protein